MFENQLMHMYDTREIEIRSRLGERRVDLVPPFRRRGDGLVARLVAAIRSARARAAAPGRRAPSPLHP